MYLRNRPRERLIIGIIVLIVVIYRTHQVTQYMEYSTRTGAASSNSFVEFLQDFFGLGPQGFFLNTGASSSHGQNQNKMNPGQSGSSDEGNQSDINPQTGQRYASGSGEGSGSQKDNTSSGSPTMAAPGNSDESPNSRQSNNGNNASIDFGSNAEINAQNNTELNSQMNTETNSETNSEILSGGGDVNNSENNAENNGTNNQGNNSENNAQNNAANNPNGPSGDATGGSSGDNSGDGGSGSGDNSNNNQNSPSNLPNPATLPTINPIPSDSSVGQSISTQNQQGESIAQELASRQAQVTPVQQQAQASKYQTISYQNIPTPSTAPTPSDIMAKVQSKQYSFH